jgi:hypothetical protein
MSRTKKHISKVCTTKEMAEVFKRKSGPQIRPTSRMKERQRWEHEFMDEYLEMRRSDDSTT